MEELVALEDVETLDEKILVSDNFAEHSSLLSHTELWLCDIHMLSVLRHCDTKVFIAVSSS